MRGKAALAPAAGLLALIAPVGPAQADTLAPAGNWQVEQTDESCRLWREFGTGAQLTRFNLYAYGPDDSLRLVLTGRQVAMDRGQATEVRVKFGSEPGFRDMVAVASRSGQDGMLSLMMIGQQPAYHYVRGWSPPGGWDWDRALIPPVEDFSSITVETGRMPPVTLELGDMAGPLDQLADCRDRLAASWGVPTPASRPVLHDPSTVLARLAMPEAMVVNHVSLIAQIRVLVNAEGRATDCIVQSPALESRQTRGLCRPMLDLARFDPARDAQGSAVPAYFRVVYSYHIFD